MAKEMWINLPVGDVEKSKEFFRALGFSFNEKYTADGKSACLVVGEKNVAVMLFPAETFKEFSRNEVPDASRTTEVLISIDAENRAEVDEMARRAAAAGGSVYAEPGEKDGWMYGCGFADLDGHRWNMLHMDFSRLPQPAGDEA
jgi:uncharacterized protein